MHVYTGCRTTKERQAKGEGIVGYDFNPHTAELTYSFVIPELINPSYLALNSAGDRLYTVHGDRTEVSSFIRDPMTGSLEWLNTQSTLGKNPVHLALDPTGRNLLVANHIGASLAILPIHAEGSLGAVTQLMSLSGEPGPHRTEQPHAKPHFNPFSPDGRFLVVPDKGLDGIFVIPYKEGQLKERECRLIKSREGAGPRHLVFHPNTQFAYCINELDSTVTTYKWDAQRGTLQAQQIIPTLPQNYTGNNRAAAIVISNDGQRLYASNRGHDSIAAFEIHSETGWLTPITHQRTHGRTPRFICLSPDNRFLLALNEDSDTIETFAVHADSKGAEHLEHRPERRIQTGSPVCLVFA